MKTKLILSFLFIILSITACNTTEPPPPPPDGEKPTLALALDDASCTEAWLQLTTKDLELPAELTLKQYNPTGDSLSKIFLLNTQDSLLYIDSLLPNQSYTFIASHSGLPSGLSGISSNELSVTTMDTTSHDFTFETFTFGGTAGSSTLYDVAIINENYILAVGTIFLNDSLGQPDPQPYGIAIWNGQNWELKKIFHSTNIPVTPRGILVINPNEIYLAAGSIFRWDGISSTVQMVFSRLNLPNPNATIEKLWGNSSSSVYGVGNVGSIVCYNGTLWSRIESGTELNINDIWGDFNEKTGEWEILAVASNVNTSTERTIIKINNITTQMMSSSPIQWSLRTVWFRPSRQYFVAGSGIYAKHNLTENEWLNNPLDITTFYTNRIRGNEINDVVGVGAFGDFVHFNGTGWKVNYQDPKLNYGSYLSLDIKENIVAAVGLEYNQAVILIASKINQ